MAKKKVTKKAVKKSTKEARDIDPYKDGFNFDPLECIRNYKKIQQIGASVCRELVRICEFDRHFNYKRVDDSAFKKDIIRIYHDCTWMEIPVDIFKQGKEAIVEYCRKKHEAKFERLRKEQEEWEKRLAKEARNRKMREYRQLKEELFGKQEEENDDEDY